MPPTKFSTRNFSLGRILETPAGVFVAGLMPITEDVSLKEHMGGISGDMMFRNISSMHGASRRVGSEESFDDSDTFAIGPKLLALLTKIDINNVVIFVARWGSIKNIEGKTCIEAALSATQQLLETSSNSADPSSDCSLTCHRSLKQNDSILSKLPPSFLPNLHIMVRPHAVIQRLATALSTLLRGQAVHGGWIAVRDTLRSIKEPEVAMLMWSPDKMTSEAWSFANDQIAGITSQDADRVHEGCSVLLLWLQEQINRCSYPKRYVKDGKRQCQVKHAIFSPEGVVTIDTSQRFRPKADATTNKMSHAAVKSSHNPIAI